MKVTTFGRLALTAGIMAVAASGLVATPAYADPATLYANNLVGFGSDTTQDVMQELSTVIGVDKLASFHSTWAAPAASRVTARPGGPTDVIRAKGSGDGFKMLKVAEGSSTSDSTVGVIDTPSTATANKANTVGQIDYARASSKQGTASTTGEYVNIPFATDVVGIAVDPDDAVSKIPLVIGTSTDAATVPSLNSIYRCNARYVYTDAGGNYVGVGADETLPAGATTASVITPQIPVFGSGTAAFFIKAIFNATDAAGWASSYSCIKRVKADGTTNIQEHDGAPIDEVDNAIGIYSIGQWVAQTKSATTGVTDRTNGTTLMALAALTTDPSTRVSATTGSGATLAPNADAWPSALKRIVYNVVAYRKAADVTSPIRAMFVGTGSLVCTNTAAIAKMGFAPLTATDGGDPTANANACGSINSANRATAGSDGVSMTTAPTVTNVSEVSAATTAVGRSFTVSVNGGVATHDMGGTVQILDAAYGTPGANVLGSATIAAGQNVLANVSVTPRATGTTKLYAYFIPTLGAIKVTNMSPVNADTDKSFATITPTNATTTKLSIRKPSNVGGTVRVVAWIDAGGAFDGGTVTLYKDTVTGTVLATDTLEAGETGAVLSYAQNVASQTIVAKFVPTNSSAVESTSSPATINLSKSTPTITWSALPAAPNGFVAGTGSDWAIGAKRVQVTSAVASINASTDIVTTTSAHGLAKGDIVYLSGGTGTTLPAGITAGTKYYVIPASGTTVTGSTFKVSTTLNGSAFNFTGTPPTVKVWKQNVAPKIAATVGTAGVTLKPTGSVKVYIGTTSNDKTREISSSSTGLTLNAGALAATLSRADNWTWATTGLPGTTTQNATVFLIVEYPGDDAFNSVTAFKQIKVTP